MDLCDDVKLDFRSLRIVRDRENTFDHADIGIVVARRENDDRSSLIRGENVQIGNGHRISATTDDLRVSMPFDLLRNEILHFNPVFRRQDNDRRIALIGIGENQFIDDIEDLTRPTENN